MSSSDAPNTARLPHEYDVAGECAHWGDDSAPTGGECTARLRGALDHAGQIAFRDGLLAGMRHAADIVMNTHIEPGPIVSPALTQAVNEIYDRVREIERETTETPR